LGAGLANALLLSRAVGRPGPAAQPGEETAA
jgi:hypothetical protein